MYRSLQIITNALSVNYLHILGVLLQDYCSNGQTNILYNVVFILLALMNIFGFCFSYLYINIFTELALANINSTIFTFFIVRNIMLETSTYEKITDYYLKFDKDDETLLHNYLTGLCKKLLENKKIVMLYDLMMTSYYGYDVSNSDGKATDLVAINSILEKLESNFVVSIVKKFFKTIIRIELRSIYCYFILGFVLSIIFYFLFGIVNNLVFIVIIVFILNALQDFQNESTEIFYKKLFVYFITSAILILIFIFLKIVWKIIIFLYIEMLFSRSIAILIYYFLNRDDKLVHRNILNIQFSFVYDFAYIFAEDDDLAKIQDVAIPRFWISIIPNGFFIIGCVINYFLA